MKKIILSEDATLSTALSLLFFGTHGQWQTRAWICEVVRGLFLIRTLVAVPAHVQWYD
jgi:hypothetical protein